MIENNGVNELIILYLRTTTSSCKQTIESVYVFHNYVLINNQQDRLFEQITNIRKIENHMYRTYRMTQSSRRNGTQPNEERRNRHKESEFETNLHTN